MKLELLSPAKNLDFGKEAINHGADAVYIGAPAFGARAAATNSIADIEALVRYAHLFGSKVFATVNTILFDDEVEPAVTMIRRLCDAGVDALIVQDMGLLECDLPPVELHASTQCHNSDASRVAFLGKAGFRRVILARETSLEQMRAIRRATAVDLEAFVHGALCVSYSGQCYMSQYLAGRSGNRGCCSQPCRSSYDLLGEGGRVLLKNRHLLSLKDFNASAHLAAMAGAGISSFKIEGRLKDLAYVKNITAHYRRLLDGLMGDDYSRASSGRCTFFFTPDQERTFNRGYTDYFLRGRQPMASLATQKSIGKPIGSVVAVGRGTVTVGGDEPLAAGDGLCFFDGDGSLRGFSVNEVHGRVVTPNAMPSIRQGTPLWRNNDRCFERQLEGRSAERRVAVNLLFSRVEGGFALEMTDEDGVRAECRVEAAPTQAENPERASAMVVKQLSKLGGTPFAARSVVDATGGHFFLPVSTLNELRRRAADELARLRVEHFRPAPAPLEPQQAVYPDVDYRANVVNALAERFYRRHGAAVTERGVEQTASYDGKALMTTKYCLRYELGCCLRGKCHFQPDVDIAPSESLMLRNNGRLFRLDFDCSQCIMRVLPG
ncbi:MAG: U32 family peptidase [Bacteroidales bacterium]|nr:U32 family peptidase [Bacteroidales bacterium]